LQCSSLKRISIRPEWLSATDPCNPTYLKYMQLSQCSLRQLPAAQPHPGSNLSHLPGLLLNTMSAPPHRKPRWYKHLPHSTPALPEAAGIADTVRVRRARTGAKYSMVRLIIFVVCWWQGERIGRERIHKLQNCHMHWGTAAVLKTPLK